MLNFKFVYAILTQFVRMTSIVALEIFFFRFRNKIFFIFKLNIIGMEGKRSLKYKQIIIDNEILNYLNFYLN